MLFVPDKSKDLIVKVKLDANAIGARGRYRLNRVEDGNSVKLVEFNDTGSNSREFRFSAADVKNLPKVIDLEIDVIVDVLGATGTDIQVELTQTDPQTGAAIVCKNRGEVPEGKSPNYCFSIDTANRIIPSDLITVVFPGTKP